MQVTSSYGTPPDIGLSDHGRMPGAWIEDQALNESMEAAPEAAPEAAADSEATATSE